jgi:biopolymer transport protein ExbB
MLVFLQEGGWVLWLIIASGLLALTVFAERAFHVHRARIKTDDFIKGICNILRRRNIAEALNICEETPGPVACMARAAIAVHDKGREAMESAMNDAAIIEIARLERRFAVLATVAQIAPLMGLLGTVLGMIDSYIVIQQKAPLVHAGDLASGVWQALITTAAGLIVAMISYAGYNLLVGKVNTIALDMERSFGEILGSFAEPAVQSQEKNNG